MKLILLSHPTKISKEPQLIEALFEQGLEYFHLRKPEYSKEEVENYLCSIPSNHHSKIILHSHFELVEKYKLKGIHLNSKSAGEDLNLVNRDCFTPFAMTHETTVAREERFKQSEKENLLPFNSNQHRSFSFHTIEEIKQCEQQYDYVFLSPVFDSISKANYKSTFDLEQVKEFLKIQKAQEIIALGGIDETRIAQARELGFSGVAVMGSIWDTFLKNESIEETVKKMLLIMNCCANKTNLCPVGTKYL